MPGELVKALHERRNQAITQAKEIAERAYQENRDLDASEQGTYDAINEEVDKLDKRIAAALEQEERSRSVDEKFNQLYRQTPDPSKRGQQGGDGSDTAAELRSWLKGESRNRFYDVLPVGTGPIQYRTLSKLTSGAGGSTVPISFYDRLMAHLVEVSAILQAGATVLRTDSGEQIQIPKTTAHSSAALTTEAASLSASDPAFSQASLGAYKYGVLIQVSRELLDDTGVDLEGYLAMQAGRALGNAFGADAITGNGSSKPTGLLNNTTLGVTSPTGVSGAFGSQVSAGQGGDLLISLFYSVISPYRMSNSAAWITNDSTMGVIRRLKDSTGNYVFQPSLVAGTPDTILGKPVYTDPFMPAMALSAKAVVFGDLSQFFIRIAGGVRFERSDDFAFANDLVTFRAILRADSILVDQTGAVKHYLGAAT